MDGGGEKKILFPLRILLSAYIFFLQTAECIVAAKVSGTLPLVTLGVGLAISDKKLFCGRRNRRNNCFVPAEFRLFRGMRKLLEFSSEPYRKREKCSEFCTKGQI
jgi:hypothetical protein